MIYIYQKYKECFKNEISFDDFFALEGKVFKKAYNRKTMRISRHGKKFFIKLHEGIGYKEIIKNLLNLRLPVLGASTEWRAIERLGELGVPTLTAVGYGIQGLNPARQRSFLITQDLGPNISLEKLTQDWPENRPEITLKRGIISQLATTARKLHEHGVNHRDFYICHFLARLTNDRTMLDPDKLDLFVIDLHRAQLRHCTPPRWIIKDLGSLLFSALDIGLTSRDVFRFIKTYRGHPLRNTLYSEKLFWNKVKNRAAKLYRSHWNTESKLLRRLG